MKKTIVATIIILSAMNTTGQIKVDCIGNSITYGYGLSSPYLMSYPSVLQNLLGTSYSVQNDGVSSTTLMKKGDISYWKNGRLSQAFNFQPNIIILKLGTNDTKPYNWDYHSSEFKTDYLAMVDTLSSMSSKPKIFVVLPVPVFNNPTAVSWGIRDSIIKKEIPLIQAVAAERNLTVIDCYTPLLKFPQFFSVDGVHPDAAGADTIAHIVYRAIISPSSVEPVNNFHLNTFITLTQTKDELQLTASLSGISIVKVFDIRGKQIRTFSLNETFPFTISTKKWPVGMYVLRLTNKTQHQAYYQNINIIM
jgi:acyl-CoA thioesterase I